MVKLGNVVVVDYRGKIPSFSYPHNGCVGKVIFIRGSTAEIKWLCHNTNCVGKGQIGGFMLIESMSNLPNSDNYKLLYD